jgi:aspartate aminotransferase
MNQLINQRVGDLPESATLEINKISNYYLSQGIKIYKFGLGQSPFPIPTCIVQELQKNAHQKDYLPVEGLPELRSAIAKYRSSKHGVQIEPSNVMIGPGSKELLFLLQLCYHGELLLPNPSWVSYAPQAKIIGRKVHWLNTTLEDNWKIQPEVLDEYCSRNNTIRLLLLNSPCNPTGSTYTSTELKNLADVARNHNLCIMSDEIYGGCTFSGQGLEGHRGQSIATHYPEGTIIFGGISKWAGAGGWRLGACSFPDEMLWLMKRMCAVASETYTSVSSPIQYAAVRAYDINNYEINHYLQATQTILTSLSKFIVGTLRSSGAKISEPGGGFYVFPDFSECPRINKEKFKTNLEMCSHILENTGVAMLAGSHFGRPEEEMTVRISFVNFDGEAAIQGWENLGCPSYQEILKTNFLQTYCPDTIEGIQVLTEYFK